MPREPIGVARAVAQSTEPRAGHSRTARARGSAGAGLIGERDREAFLDILSHELRTPVTIIYGGAELLANRELPPKRRRALAADVRGEAERLYRLVEDLVILVRSERDGIRPVGEPVAVGRLMRAAIERESARHAEVRIGLLGDSDAAADGADEGLVAHVIRNLLDNAIRYGGDAGPIEVVVHATETEITVRVIDRGEPPDPEGNPFELSADSGSTAAGRAGAGIGLYVADRLVAAMDGRMWAARSDSHGAEYGFALRRFAGARPGRDA